MKGHTCKIYVKGITSKHLYCLHVVEFVPLDFKRRDSEYGWILDKIIILNAPYIIISFIWVNILESYDIEKPIPNTPTTYLNNITYAISILKYHILWTKNETKM